MNEIDILNKNIGGMTIREMTAMTFLQWVAKCLNNLKAYRADVVELTTLVSSPPMSRFMTDEEKIRIINKLIKLGITI